LASEVPFTVRIADLKIATPNSVTFISPILYFYDGYAKVWRSNHEIGLQVQQMRLYKNMPSVIECRCQQISDSPLSSV
jgi:hypothetical protein